MDEFLTRLKIRCSDWSIFCQESSQNLNSRQNHRVYVGFAISKFIQRLIFNFDLRHRYLTIMFTALTPTMKPLLLLVLLCWAMAAADEETSILMVPFEYRVESNGPSISEAIARLEEFTTTSLTELMEMHESPVELRSIVSAEVGTWIPLSTRTCVLIVLLCLTFLTSYRRMFFVESNMYNMGKHYFVGCQI